MNIHIPNLTDKIGGGWTQARLLAKELGHVPYGEADIYFIVGATQAERSEVQQAKKDGKKIVLRVDNALRNSANRGTGMPRLKDFCELADLVIYQSEWAKKFLYPFTKKDGAVILNGVDTSVFNTDSRDNQEETYLYSRTSRDENKGWLMTWYWYTENVKDQGHLDIIGKFSRENMEYNFDFYSGEKFKYYGQVHNPEIFYKKNKYFLYSYLNDACSNGLLEARACGMEIIDVYGMLNTGGASEIMGLKDLSKERMIKEYEECLARIA